MAAKKAAPPIAAKVAPPVAAKGVEPKIVTPIIAKVEPKIVDATAMAATPVVGGSHVEAAMIKAVNDVDEEAKKIWEDESKGSLEVRRKLVDKLRHPDNVRARMMEARKNAR
jgi:hypothetical protein